MSLRPPPGWDAPPLPSREVPPAHLEPSPFFPEPGSTAVAPPAAPVPAPAYAVHAAPLGDVRPPPVDEPTGIFLAAPRAPAVDESVAHDLAGVDRVTPVMGTLHAADPYGAAYPTPLVPPATSPTVGVDAPPASRPSVSEALRARLAPAALPPEATAPEAPDHLSGFVLGPSPGEAVPPPSARRAALAAAAAAPPAVEAPAPPPRVRLGLLLGVTVVALAIAGLVSFFVMRGSSSSAPTDETTSSAAAKPTSTSKKKKAAPGASATGQHTAGGKRTGPGSFRSLPPRGLTPAPTPEAEPTEPGDEPEGEPPSPYPAPRPPRGH